jgi:hypothetical protein
LSGRDIHLLKRLLTSIFTHVGAIICESFLIAVVVFLSKQNLLHRPSLDFNPWKWLTSKEAAEAMATEVATWPDKYGCDGIDLDIEEGAGTRLLVNLIHSINSMIYLL